MKPPARLALPFKIVLLLLAAWLHSASAQAGDAAEEALWNAARQASEAADIQIYLDLYPDGDHAEEARALIRKIEDAAKAEREAAEAAASQQAAADAEPKPAPRHECDDLAANPDDEDKVGEGVQFEKMDATAAVGACREAVRLYPDEARFQFQLGRAEFKLNRHEQAAGPFRKAADAGYVPAMVGLGQIMIQGSVPGIGTPTDGVAMLERAAETGYALAPEALGLIYMRGLGGLQDYEKAARWNRQAAEAGRLRGMAFLGEQYYDGKGVKQDYLEAFLWLRQAAERGWAPSQRTIGYMLRHGQGVAKDYDKARHYLRLAVDQKDAFSMTELGIMHLNGEGGQKNEREACRLFKGADEQSQAGGIGAYGYCLENGIGGVAKDFDGAVSRYRKAAALDNDFANTRLAQLKIYPFDVAELQRRLNDAGFDAGKPDGRIGRRTEAAIRAFQKAKGINEDGLAKLQVFNALSPNRGGGGTAAASGDGGKFDDF